MGHANVSDMRGHANVSDMREARDCKTSAERTVVGHAKDKAIVNVMLPHDNSKILLHCVLKCCSQAQFLCSQAQFHCFS